MYSKLMDHERISQEIYQPMSRGLIRLFRCVWFSAAIALLLFYKVIGDRDAVQLAVLGSLGIAIFESIFALSVYRRKRIFKHGIATRAIVVRKYETSRGPVCKIVAGYTFNGAEMERHATVSTNSYHRLQVGQEFGILVLPNSSGNWMVDVRTK